MLSLYDVKSALLKLVKDYEYTSVVVITMALSLSVSMFLYAQVYAMNFKPLPFPEADRWVQVTRLENGNPRVFGGISSFEAGHFEKRQTSIESFGWWEPYSSTVSTEKSTFMVTGATTTSQLFTLTQVPPLLGRTLTPEDEIPGAENVVVIGYDLWVNNFEKDPNIVDTSISVDGNATRIVGVMPEGFLMPGWHSMWHSRRFPLPETPVGGGWVTFYGLLKEGVSLQQAQAEYKQISQELENQYPKEFQGKSTQLDYYTQFFANNTRIVTWIMGIISVAILAIGCFSVGNLLLVRSLENSRETIIKAALGLPLNRIVGAVLLESFILCVCAGLLGILLCNLAVSYLAGGTNFGPFWWSTDSGTHLYFTCAIFVAITWFITGILPTWSAFRGPTTEGLSVGSKGGTSTKTGRMTQAFVSLQVFFAFILMVFTGISVVALNKVLNADYGVETENYLTAGVKLPEASYPQLTDRIAFYQRLQNSVEALPGAIDVGYAAGLAGGFSYLSSYQSLEREILEDGSTPKATEIPVSDNYFSLMGIQLLQGREFSPADTESKELVATINLKMAQRLWPDETQYVGRKFQLNPESDGPTLTVVGVTSEVIYGSPLSNDTEDLSVIYRPMYQIMHSWWSMFIMIKTRDNPLEMIEPLKDAAREVDASIAVNNPESFENYLAYNSTRIKDLLFNFLPASILAMLMSGLGIYGITKRTVFQKTPEVGILKALGISDSRISQNFLKISTWQFIFGVVPGIIFIFLALPAIMQNSVSIDTFDTTIVSVVIFLLIGIIVFTASFLPLIKLHKLSPKEAMSFGGSE